MGARRGAGPGFWAPRALSRAGAWRRPKAARRWRSVRTRGVVFLAWFGHDRWWAIDDGVACLRRRARRGGGEDARRPDLERRGRALRRATRISVRCLMRSCGGRAVSRDLRAAGRRFAGPPRGHFVVPVRDVSPVPARDPVREMVGRLRLIIRDASDATVAPRAKRSGYGITCAPQSLFFAKKRRHLRQIFSSPVVS